MIDDVLNERIALGVSPSRVRRAARNQVERELWIDPIDNLKRFPKWFALEGQNDQKIDVRIWSRCTAGIGSKQNDLFGAELPRNLISHVLEGEALDLYRDWGKEVLYKVERGEGECSK